MKYGTEAIVERVTRDVIFSPLFTKNKIQSLEMGLPINKSVCCRIVSLEPAKGHGDCYLVDFKKMSERQTKAGNQITLSLSLTLSHYLTLSHSHTLSVSHSITLDMLNKFCFHV